MCCCSKIINDLLVYWDTVTVTTMKLILLQWQHVLKCCLLQQFFNDYKFSYNNEWHLILFIHYNLHITWNVHDKKVHSHYHLYYSIYKQLFPQISSMSNAACHVSEKSWRLSQHSETFNWNWLKSSFINVASPEEFFKFFIVK